MAIFGKKESCPLCSEKTGLFNMPYQLDSGEAICTKCVILLAGTLKMHQEQLKPKSMDEIRLMYNNKQKQVTDQEKAKEELLSNFQPNRAFSDVLLIDESNRQFRSFVETRPENIYPLDIITGYEIVENGTSVVSGGLGRAVAGGLLFGGTGAIVGAITGTKKQSTLITDMKLKLTTNNLDTPVLYFNLISKPIKSDSPEYRSRITAAEEVIASLDIILKKD
jgi:hypothetical protein